MTTERLRVAAPSHWHFERIEPIRFAHCDPAGIVFFPQYLVLFNGLVEDWVTHGLGIRHAELIGPRRVGLPTVSLQCEFVAPGHHGDELSFRLAVREIGRSALHLTSGAYGPDGQARVRIEQVLVITSLETHRPIPMPDDLRSAMERCVAPLGLATRLPETPAPRA